MLNNPVIYFFGFIIIMSALIMLSAFFGIFIRTQPTVEKFHKKLVNARGVSGNILASFFGMITPFCSCTTVPIFAGLLSAGVEIGTAISFLIASPSIGFAAMILLFVLFGARTAVAYTIASVLVAIIGGCILRLFKIKEPLRRTFISMSEYSPTPTRKQALISSWHLLKHFLPMVILCALIGVAIKDFIPQSFLIFLTANNSVWLIPIVVVVGSAIYADIIFLIPVGFALIEKGVNQGIVLAFMLAAAGISIPSILLLSKVIKMRLLIYFVVTLMLLYTLLGLIFYYL